MKKKDILKLRVDDEHTIGSYLKELLLTLWSEGEGFSGKRPFGNSGWEHDLYAPLVKYGVVKGFYDSEYDDIESYDYAECNMIIEELIHYIFKKVV